MLNNKSFTDIILKNKINIKMLILRVLTILSKVILVLIITKKGSLSIQGELTLIITTIAIINLLTGLETHNIVNRELVGKKLQSKHFSEVFSNHLSGIFLVNIGFAIIILPFFYDRIFYYILIVVITICDHVNQEVFRALISVNKQLMAYFLNFLRQGTWAFIATGLFYFDIIDVSVNATLGLWAIFTSLTVFVFLVIYPQILFKVKFRKEKFINNIYNSRWLFLCLIPFKIIELSDRYFIEYFIGSVTLGTYSLLYQVINAMNILIFTVIISNEYANLTLLAKTKTFHDLLLVLSKINVTIKKIYLYASPCAIIGVIIIFYILNIELNYSHIITIFILLLSSYLFNIALIRRIVYIGRNMFKDLFLITLLSSAVFLSLNFILVPMTGIMGASFSQLSAFYIFYLKSKNVLR